MSTQVFRLSESSLLFPVWKSIRECKNNKLADLGRISRSLAKSSSLTESEAAEVLDKFTEDGLVVRNTIGKTDVYSLPDVVQNEDDEDSEVLDNTGVLLLLRDAYCYECHSAGEVLECSQCPRVFHVDCVRPDAALDLPLLPFKEPVPQVIQNTFSQVYGVQCPRPRSRNTTPLPATSFGLHPVCINCRLTTANMHVISGKAMLNDLLELAFGRIRSWISLDTFSSQEPQSIDIPEEYVRQLGTVLFQKMFTANDIAEKIGANKYGSLVEFQCDIMDVMHCIGVLRGVHCSDYEAAKYLLLDALHAIKEITKCPDCFRHSSIKGDDQWFIKPCHPPHELVYAKQTGYSYWPAKVIQKMDNSYDVRFFGQQHSRATIPVRFIKPISGKAPDMKPTGLLKKALAEFERHKEMLEGHPVGMTEQSKVATVVDTPKKVGKRKAPVKKAERARKIKKNADIVAISDNDENHAVDENQSFEINLESELTDNTQPITSTPLAMMNRNEETLELVCSDDNESTISDYFGREADEDMMPQKTLPTIDSIYNARPLLRRLDDTSIYNHNLTLQSTTNGDASDHSPPSLGTPDDAATAINDLREDLAGCPAKYVQIAVLALRRELRTKKAMMARHADALLETKRTQWCYKCLQPAIYYCCWRISYCSAECQNQHWTEGHKKSCKRPRDKKYENCATQTE